MNEVEALKDKVICTGAVHFRANLESLEVARCIGRIIQDPISGAPVDLINNSEQSRRNLRHLSFGCSETELPFHTDYPNLNTPPRFVLLRCINEGPTSIATQYVSLSKFSRSPLAEKLVNEPWLVQTREGRWKPCRIVVFNREGLIQIRFSSNVMRPFFPKRSELSALSMTAHELFPTSKFSLKRGDYLLIDNWSGLHRRTIMQESATGLQPQSGSNRVLERVLIG
jgi:hypothetical protein